MERERKYRRNISRIVVLAIIVVVESFILSYWIFLFGSGAVTKSAKQIVSEENLDRNNISFNIYDLDDQIEELEEEIADYEAAIAEYQADIDAIKNGTYED